jgi:hypothetical protein
MACACAGASKKAGKSGTGQDPLDVYFTGTFAGGVKETFCSFRSSALTIKKITLPNLIFFSENPCLGIGSRLILQNKERATCLTNFDADVYTVTAAPTLVGSEWQVPVDALWGTNGTETTITFQSNSGYEACATTATSNPLQAQICAGNQLAINWSGYVTTRPLNTFSVSAPIYVVSGSKVVSASDASFKPRTGDYLELEGTALVDGNRGIIKRVSREYDKDRKTLIKITLDREVTGITEAPIAGTSNVCVRGTARARVIAQPYFNTKACCMEMILDASVTSSEDWPMGDQVTGGGQAYYITVLDKTPGHSIPVYQGKLVLT